MRNHKTLHEILNACTIQIYNHEEERELTSRESSFRVLKKLELGESNGTKWTELDEKDSNFETILTKIDVTSGLLKTREGYF